MLFLFMAVTGVIYTGDRHAHRGVGPRRVRRLPHRGVRGARSTAPACPGPLLHALHASCMIITIVVGAKVFGYFFTLTQSTQATRHAG